MQLNLEKMLEAIQSGNVPIDENLKEYMQYLQRWKIDAPRKKALRKMRLKGIHVLTTDELFEQDENGEQIIANLENTGYFADYFLNTIYN